VLFRLMLDAIPATLNDGGLRAPACTSARMAEGVPPVFGDSFDDAEERWTTNFDESRIRGAGIQEYDNEAEPVPQLRIKR
jgi:hypothetical protein